MARAPAHAARDDRLEPRPARRGRAAPVRPPLGIPRRLELEAAEAVCDADIDTLASLTDKSLVRHDDRADGEPRYAMLETIGEFARERLDESAEPEELRRRHAEHFVAIGLTAEPELPAS
jgi:predicted ATPase